MHMPPSTRPGAPSTSSTDVPGAANMANPPCVLHEDEHLLVVNKPPGWNTHAPAPYAGPGIYDWLRHREPRWAKLAIVHRLDRETSGVMVFAKSALASRSLTEQFGARRVGKRYLLRTDGAVPTGTLRVETAIARAGERYLARPAGSGDAAVTLFTAAAAGPGAGRRELAAEPLTGRTHQIRVHAAANGFPVLGDTLYGGSSAPRLCLHAERIAFHHPQSGEEVAFVVPADFDADPGRALRGAIIDSGTDAFRLIHGAADRQPQWYVDQLGDYLLSQADADLTESQRSVLEALPARGIYHKRLSRRVRELSATEASPAHVHGSAAPDRFEVRENGVHFEIGFAEGYSVGLFLDQRDNRRRFLVNHVGAGFTLFPAGAAGRTVLNTFAYTCGFSVCAAIAGATVTSLDLSKKYLDWGRRNFALNGLEPAAHDFIFGDAFDWLRRLRKKGRLFDAILLDPPTFSQSAEGGTFRAERDYGKLVAAALPVLAPGGVLLACANTARLPAEDFLETVRGATATAGRSIGQEHYAAQPPDFPITRDEPGHLKSVWLRVT